ncbi:lipoyl(octanoyl) transferase LipB [Bdellovibrio bacteriovorus]|uniref:Octanoyltransferase n=1 Tax=Bdellovibrio bacteriovorus (strain ATCC 15356 / DSM 50701 / NCIMB 9529 / HD100) TaxID=264462 RepID=LIPB_BDEBA|nr:lipoyl(octanoyl) transferase LipB [Bdellovibrio bacteriovorus]Q6MPS6.2 RecName: Full=Octanoyltransferase; AltName: Full=Lipoate-protein ligase B; AltName: Full=Lipoyl/octanoyl transferase; AltName: Full=Octanoyl-[acyl-carrier-protein]-protein N-octanoyltransferase [Bdellovibrio bacteriovorus HD100]AHZ86829.1 octanoyltransferase [Bdellovibrio bacteriovorus]BEV67270.1 Octanoyltransferase [Bdellovibrio bacteriovorus]
MADLIFQDWGLINYDEALKKQNDLVEKVHTEDLPGFLVFCTHPPVVTVGRATQAGDVFSWNGPVVEVTRGGRATYHGPSQLVVYPILNLAHVRKGRKDREINPYLKVFEDAIVDVLKTYGLTGIEGRSSAKSSFNRADADDTGVWVNDLKIASVGVGVRKWVAFHGAAINLTFDEKAFLGLRPCGFPSEVMVSLEQLTGAKVDVGEFKEKLKRRLLEVL